MKTISDFNSEFVLLQDRLEELLNESSTAAFERSQTAFDLFSDPFLNSIVLFGAGNLGRKALAGLIELGIKPLAFADNNSKNWNTEIEGIPVLSPEIAAEKFGKSAVFLVTIWRAGSSHRLAHTRRQLEELGCQQVISVTYLFWKYPDIFLPHYCLDLPSKVLEESDRIRQAFKLWTDVASAKEFLVQLRWRLWLDFDGLSKPVQHEQYFPTDLFTGLTNEVFIDCGAYDGDTIAARLAQHGDDFCQIFALEPDPKNISKLEAYISKLSQSIQEKIKVLPLAASSSNSKVNFSANGNAASAIGQTGTLEIDCVTLDSILIDSPPTFIKMDIEGAELDALIGSKDVIEKHNPVLAICAYHQQDHLWRVPLLIAAISSEYKFFLRAHGEECYDCVCYAIPLNRLSSDWN
jgi:FkbM family methyltransferase